MPSITPKHAQYRASASENDIDTDHNDLAAKASQG